MGVRVGGRRDEFAYNFIGLFGYCLSVFLCFWTILFKMGLSIQHIWIENGCQSGWEKRCRQLYISHW